MAGGYSSGTRPGEWCCCRFLREMAPSCPCLPGDRGTFVNNERAPGRIQVYNLKKKVMKDFGNGNYPPGAANDPRAPWNEPGDNDPIEVDVDYSVMMMRTATIKTTDYEIDKWEDCERDDDGYFVGVCGESYNYDNTDWKEEYSNQCMSPIELIGVLEEICEKLLNGEELKINKERLQYLLDECMGWDCDDEEVTQA